MKLFYLFGGYYTIFFPTWPMASGEGAGPRGQCFGRCPGLGELECWGLQRSKHRKVLGKFTKSRGRGFDLVDKRTHNKSHFPRAATLAIPHKAKGRHCAICRGWFCRWVLCCEMKRICQQGVVFHYHFGDLFHIIWRSICWRVYSCTLWYTNITMENHHF